MRKLVGLMALVSVLGLTAASAPAAFAGVASESLPNTEVKNWKGVETNCGSVGCKFDATSTKMILTSVGTPFITCEWVLEGLIFGDGTSKITSGKVKTETALCKRFHINTNTAWADRICEYTGSTPPSYWDRISINFFDAFGEEIKGPVYVHLLNAKKEDENPLTVKFESWQKFASPLAPAELGKGPWGLLASGAAGSGSTMFEFGNEAVTVEGTREACGWNFEKENLNELP